MKKAALFSFLLFSTLIVEAYQDTRERRIERWADFDIRANLRRSIPIGQGSEMRQSVLRREVPDARVKWSGLSGGPSRLRAGTRPLLAAQGEDRETSARLFLRRHRDLYRLTDREINDLTVGRRDRTAHNGAMHLHFRQAVAGIEIFQGEYVFSFDRQGEMVSAFGELFAGAAGAVNRRDAVLTAGQAVELAAGPERNFSRPPETRLVYFPLSGTQLRLAWECILWLRQSSRAYLVMIDAERGSLLYRQGMTWECFPVVEPAAATVNGLVYTGDSPRPNLPAASGSPPIVARVEVPFQATPYLDRTIYPPGDPHLDWWAGQPRTGLVGNNVDAHLDRDANDLADEPRVAPLDDKFSFPIDFTQDPTTAENQRASQVNLFYWVNRFHDILYSYGFTEAAGNFQASNFGYGGLGNDAIEAEAQDGSGTNNANYTGGRDGSEGRVQFFLWTGNPMLDGGLDQSIILHELAHGLSTRLVGNGFGLNGLQAQGLGEGWSDYFGLALQRQAEDDLDGNYAIGQYAYNNYVRGIRRYPYSLNLAVNPLHYGNVAQNRQIHAIGEIWAVTLLEMRALLIRQRGFSAGHHQGLQLAVDGLKMTPSAPTFLDARDAILLADRLNDGGRYQCTIWQAFSKRGMGYSASSDDVNDAAPVAAFDLPPFCSDLGTIRADRITYVPGENVTVTLADRNGPASPQVKLRGIVTGDEETIVLTPDALHLGSYSGSLRMVSGQATPGDGTLQISIRQPDGIRIVYEDLNDGSGAARQASLEVPVSGEEIVFFDDVEKGNPGWSIDGTTGTRWGIREQASPIPTRVWTDSPFGNYANDADCSLVSPRLDCSRARSVTLTWTQSYLLETGFDYGIVEYSIDDGSTWSRAAGYTGTQSIAARAELRLDALAGQAKARLRFRLRSDVFSNADGWTIDNITVMARTAAFNNEMAPEIYSVSPAFGSPDGGTQIALAGVNFTDAGDIKVFFDGVAASNVKVIGETALTLMTPPHPAGEVDLRIETRRGNGTLARAFTYFTTGTTVVAGSDPEILNIFPSSGTARGGTVVTVNGANFRPDTKILFGAQSATVTYLNSSLLRAVAPASPNNAVGEVDIVASNSATQSTRLAKAFTYRAPTPPALAIESPNGGERVFTGSVLSLRWRSSDNRAIKRHRLALYRNQGGTLSLLANIADYLPGETQSFNWTIPVSFKPTTQARLLLTAIDDEENETTVLSGGDFAIERRWETMANLFGAIQRTAGVSDGRYIYLFGGRPLSDSGTTTPIVQRYDPQASPPVWSHDAVPQMPVGLNAARAVVVDNRIYLPGGINAQIEIEPRQFVYEPAARSWGTLPAPTIGVFLYALAADPAQPAYYLTGGVDRFGPVSALQRYDIATQTWLQLPSMKEARFAHEMVQYNGKYYVAGGIGAIGGLTGVEVYDPATRTWSRLADLPRARSYATGALAVDARGKTYWLLVGGEDADTETPLDSVIAYDFERNLWLSLDGSFHLPAPRTKLAGVAHGGYFHAMGGAITLLGISLSTNQHERLKIEGFTLLGPNQPPTLAVPDRPIVAVPGIETKFAVTAQDQGSGEPISLAMEGEPTGAAFSANLMVGNMASGQFRWTPAIEDVGKRYEIRFIASDGRSADTKSVALTVVRAEPMAVVSSADYRGGPLAAGSLASAFGGNLAVRIEAARATPLPISLAETRITVNGLAARLLFVSPVQVNFLMPAPMEPGPAVVMIQNGERMVSVAETTIAPAAPAIFTADGSGKGEAAAIATRDGLVYQTSPFEIPLAGPPNILVLFGTGLRYAPAASPADDNGVAEAVEVSIDGIPARTLYAGAQGVYSGLDQLNVILPASLAGGRPGRKVEVRVTVAGIAANPVTISLK